MKADIPERITKHFTVCDQGMNVPLPVTYIRLSAHLAALAERDATIAALRAELADERAASEGALMILAQERAEVAKLRAEVERWQRVGASHLDSAEDDLAEIARLRSGITAAVEGHLAGAVLCDSFKEANAASVHREAAAHLRALLDPQAPDAGDGKR